MLLALTCTYSFSTQGLPGKAARQTSCTGHLGTRTFRIVRAAPRAVTVHFIENDVSVEAQPKDNMIEVAERAGVCIEAGCNSGSCGICEVEVRKFREGDTETEGAPTVVRACIAAIPPGYSRIEIAPMDDQIWGADGWDT